MRTFASMGLIDVFYAHFDVHDEQARRPLGTRSDERLTRLVGRAERKDRHRAFARLTTTDGGVLRFREAPPLLMPLASLAREAGAEVDADALRARLLTNLAAYRSSLREDLRVLLDGYTPVDMAHKVVGVGSVGTRAWVVLMVGQDAGDPLLLQIKQAGPSVLEPWAGASAHRSHGERVVRGQRRMQASGDVLLGWLNGSDGRDYYVRQLWDAKGSVDVEKMTATELSAYGELCGWTLARAHTPLRRPHGDRGLRRRRRRARPRAAQVRRGLRRPDRARPRDAGRGDP